MEDDSNEAMDRVRHKQDKVHKDGQDRQGDIRQDVVHLDEDMDKADDLDQDLPDVEVGLDDRDHLDAEVGQVQVRLDAEADRVQVRLDVAVELDEEVVQGVEVAHHHLGDVRPHFRDHLDVHHRYRDDHRHYPGVHHHRHQEDDLLPDRRDLNFEIGLCLTIESTDH